MADNTPARRRYSDHELNQLLGALREVLSPQLHHPSVGLLLSMALFLEMTHTAMQSGGMEDWMTDVIPSLHRELLRGTAMVLRCGVMAVDESSETQVH